MSVYSELLARRGAKALALACAVGWLAFGGNGLAIVLLVADRTGSFAAAGAAVSAFALGAALAPLRGRLVDARGAPVLVAFGAAHTAGLLLLLTAPEGVATVTAAGFAGAAAPPLIATARAVWPRVAGPELTRPAHALNALLGDVGAVLGPALTGALAAWLGPGAALAVLAAGPLAGCVIVAGLGVPRAAGGDARGLRVSAGLRTILIAEIGLGVAIGAIDVAAPALAEDEGSAELAALPLAAFAAGSVASSLWAGRSSLAADRGFVLGYALLAVALAGCALAGSVIALALVLVVAGAAYGVLNVGIFQLLDVVVPARRAVEALTWLTTAGGIGIAVGAAVAGRLAADSPRSALLLAAVATAPGALVAAARRRTLS